MINTYMDFDGGNRPLLPHFIEPVRYTSYIMSGHRMNDEERSTLHKQIFLLDIVVIFYDRPTMHLSEFDVELAFV